jgi:hypothetical protein
MLVSRPLSPHACLARGLGDLLDLGDEFADPVHATGLLQAAKIDLVNEDLDLAQALD